MEKIKLKKKNICIFGLGYVGLPLAIAFSKYFNVLGFDNNEERIKNLKKNVDLNNSITKKILIRSKIKFSSNEKDIKDCNIFIVTVPTPINKNKSPDLIPLKKATITISKYLKKNDFVIYESTVYPGLTEEILVPILKKKNRFNLNKDFFVGYSPERISPGDKRKLSDIIKIVSGSNKSSSKIIFNLYKKIIKAGVYLAPNIKTAEASKILENIQRDINISLMNEASIIFNKLDINTFEVLKAAGTKWNFLKFTPGLVGGHCISVDPYYMKYKAKKIGIETQVISSGRKINEKMVNNIFNRIIKYFKSRKLPIRDVGIMGLSFKENSSDTRNSQIFKAVKLFKNKKIRIQLLDPKVDKTKLSKNYRQHYVNKFNRKLDCLILSTPHDEFIKLKESYFKKILKNNSLIFDVKNKLKVIKNNSIKIMSL